MFQKEKSSRSHRHPPPTKPKSKSTSHGGPQAKKMRVSSLKKDQTSLDPKSAQTSHSRRDHEPDEPHASKTQDSDEPQGASANEVQATRLEPHDEPRDVSFVRATSLKPITGQDSRASCELIVFKTITFRVRLVSSQSRSSSASIKTNAQIHSTGQPQSEGRSINGRSNR